ncbi:MAG TPA: Calx-beta domain-containing protein [Rhodospirillales bacterium]|nr:Calx-beta domain-containing protein [Rhodospirillales bacterium]
MLAGIGMHAGVLVAAPGDLDPGFGDHGRIELPFDGGLDDWAAAAGPAVVRQPDGRVLVARTDRTGSDPMDSEVAVARLRPDGTLDPEFGTGGFVRLRFRVGEAAGVGGMALLPDGRIVVVGYSINGWLAGGMGESPNLDTGFALVRADGSLDPDGFGSGGRIALDLSAAGRPDHAVATVALEDGRIVVAGTAEGASGTRFLMVRMTTQGNLDLSFGERDGFAWTSSISSLAGFHRSTSGQFVACGTSYAGPVAEGRVVRFDSAGDLVGETSLASAGIEQLTACAPQEDGSVVVGGLGRDGTWLGRLDVDGQLDPAFGEQSGRTPVACDSCAIWDRLGYPVVPTDIAVLADGRLTVALYGYGWGHLALRSFAPDGRADTGSAPSLTDRYYDMGWRELPPSAGASTLLATKEGDQYAAVAGSQGTTVIRLKASGGPGANVIGLLGDFTQQSESDSRGLLACRSGSSDGMVTVNFATRDDTAKSPDDYVPASGVLTWGDGETGCKAIPITVKVDDRLEPTESIWVELADPVGAGLAMDKAHLHILDVQSPGPAPAPAPAPEPTPRGDSNRGGGGGAAGSALLMMLAALACLRRFAQLAVARRRRTRAPFHSIR